MSENDAALQRVQNLADRLSGPDCKWESFTPVAVASMIERAIAGDDFAEESWPAPEHLP
jgi:hypothetical protein